MKATRHADVEGTTKLLLNVDEAGEVLGLSPWTIRRWIIDGKMRPVRMGSRVMVEPSECQRLINEGRKAAVTAEK